MDNPKLKPADKKREISEMFENKSVVSMWGHHKTYRVIKVVFDKNPKNFNFTSNSGEELSVASYFKKLYGFTLRED